ncbi:MAG: hypothetical protein EOP88_05900 [Verrucomicrobiaceae bacterium]|nr:MAG: hypothetical protein EOP88_05900 [Verrucomicrobiaceae bacterium]
MQPAEITAALYRASSSPNGLQAVRHFIVKIRDLDKDSILEGLLATFEHRSCTAHEIACAVLWCLEVPFTRNLVVTLKQLLPNWDLSVEELPFYLAAACGKENLEEALDQIRETVEDCSPVAEKLDTFHWWLSADARSIEEIRETWNCKLIC